MSRSRPISARHRFLPQVEALEDRRVPTVLPVAIHLPPIHLPGPGQAPAIHLPPNHLPGVFHLPGGHISLTRRVTFDPGTLTGVTAGELKFFLSLAVANHAISENHGGDHVRVSNIQVTDVQVPPHVSRTTVTFQADFQYRKTRGFPQFQASGSLQFTVQPLVQADFRPFVVSPQTLLKAVVLPQNINVTALNVDRLPHWLSNDAKVRDFLSHQLTVDPIDVTAFVQAYLQQGGTLPSGSIFTIPHGLHGVRAPV